MAQGCEQLYWMEQDDRVQRVGTSRGCYFGSYDYADTRDQAQVPARWPPRRQLFQTRHEALGWHRVLRAAQHWRWWRELRLKPECKEIVRNIQHEWRWEQEEGRFHPVHEVRQWRAHPERSRVPIQLKRGARASRFQDACWVERTVGGYDHTSARTHERQLDVHRL